MNEPNESTPDLRAEVAAAIWLDKGGDPDRLLFEPVGLFGRSYHRDIEKNEIRDIGRAQWNVFRINREGIYDSLPEGLFHLPTRQTSDSKKKIEEIRIQRQKEKAARQFFLPLEQEYYLVRLWTEFIEQRANELQTVNAFADVMRSFWQLPDFLDAQRTLRLLEWLPVLSGVSENLDALAAFLELMLGEPVTLEWTDAPSLSVESTGGLGSGRLGETILFGGLVSTYLPGIGLTAHLRDGERLKDYLPNQPGRRLLDWLVEWFLPAEAEVTIRIVLPEEDFFTLNGDAFGAARLGYSTWL